MIPDRDYYADKHGKLTDDPEKYAQQIAVAGCFLPDHVAQRYGITDALVSVDEPNAPRRVRSGGASVKIIRADEEKGVEKETEPEPKAETPEVTAAEPKADKAIAVKPAKKAEAKKGAKKK